MTEFAPGDPGRQEPMMTLWQEAFGDEEPFIRQFFIRAYAPERCRIALCQGELAGMLFWFDCTSGDQKMAYIYGVATRRQFQGRGIATDLLQNTQEHLRQRGYSAVLLVAASESLIRFYEARGYRMVSWVDQGQTGARGSAFAQRIGAEAYMDLRQGYLPKGGLVQTGENTRFLDGLADCYRAEDFLAAVSRQEPERCLEFLGNRERIAGFAGFLGREKLQWRAPGNSVPFAMGLRLDDNAWAEPVYLGFAFD